MADDVQDIYVSTGSGTEWQSLSALAAEQVDATLPISSDDGTVVLDSPSANTFTVSTGGAERVAVSTTDATFSVPVRTTTVKGLVDTDAQIDLRTNATVTGNRVSLVSTENGWGTTLLVQSNLMIHKYGAVNGSEKHQVKETDGSYTQILDVVYVGLDSTYNDGFGTGPGSAFLDYQQGGLFTKAKNSIRFITANGGFSSGLYLRSTDVDGTDSPLVNLSTKDVLMEFKDGQATLKKNTTNPFTPTQPESIATKQTVDDKIWVGTTAEYLAIPIRDILPTTLYCLTD